MVKKISISLFIMSMLLSLCGCSRLSGPMPGQTDEGQSENTVTEKVERTYTIEKLMNIAEQHKNEETGSVGHLAYKYQYKGFRDYTSIDNQIFTLKMYIDMSGHADIGNKYALIDESGTVKYGSYKKKGYNSIWYDIPDRQLCSRNQILNTRQDTEGNSSWLIINDMDINLEKERSNIALYSDYMELFKYLKDEDMLVTAKEIILERELTFDECLDEDNKSFIYSSLSFFSGLGVNKTLDEENIKDLSLPVVKIKAYIDKETYILKKIVFDYGNFHNLYDSTSSIGDGYLLYDIQKCTVTVENYHTDDSEPKMPDTLKAAKEQSMQKSLEAVYYVFSEPVKEGTYIADETMFKTVQLDNDEVREDMVTDIKDVVGKYLVTGVPENTPVTMDLFTDSIEGEKE